MLDAVLTNVTDPVGWPPMKILPITPKRVATAAGWRGRRALRRLAGVSATAPSAQIGMVEEFSAGRVSGWVAVSKSHPPVRIELVVGDQVVGATWATTARTDRSPARGEIRRFDLRVRDLWSYLRTSDRLSVRAGGVALPIAGSGMQRVPERNGRHTLADLHTKMDQGHVFDQTGRLQLSKKLDTAWQGQVLDLYDEVRAIVTETRGYDVFLFYGTLLGAVREGTVIGHDVDFDCAYVSALRKPREAALELRALALEFIDRGYKIKCAHTALHIYSKSHPDVKIDVFHTYFDDSDTLCLPFGMAGTVDVASSEWQGTTDIEFCGRSVQVPVNAEQVTELLYGVGWRSPQPGFEWDRDRTKRHWPGVLSLADVEEVYWANFYARTEFTTGSSFFEKINGRPDTPGSVIDLGCGDGRDSYAFGLADRTVLGLDRSTVGVRHARRKAEEMGLADRVRFDVGDLGDADGLRSMLTEAQGRGDGPVLFYLRFILHSIPADVQSVLMQVLTEVARPGDMLAAEFRTDKDEKKSKTYGNHYRRFQNGPAFGADLSGRGFEVLDVEEGTGLSPYKGEDPEIYRVVARFA